MGPSDFHGWRDQVAGRRDLATTWTVEATAGGSMAIERKPIRRGGIKSAGYDRDNRILEIEFDNGSVVQHTAVGEEIARRFISSSSPASVYKDTIQEEFTIKRIK